MLEQQVESDLRQLQNLCAAQSAEGAKSRFRALKNEMQRLGKQSATAPPDAPEAPESEMPYSEKDLKRMMEEANG